MRLGIDLDGVCCDFIGGAATWIKNEWGITIPLVNGEAPTWDFIEEHIGKHKWDEFWKTAIPRGLFRHLRPLPYAVDALTAMANEDKHDLYFITNRGKDGRRDTYEWVLTQLPAVKPAGIITIKTGESKGQFPCDAYIDDKPENVLKICYDRPNALTVLQRRLYNKDFRWSEIAHDLDSFRSQVNAYEAFHKRSD